MASGVKKQHISIEERTAWDKVVTDFTAHKGTGGTQHHPLGNGTVPGFSMNDFSNSLKTKLDNIATQANNYIHPETHPASMITGLHNVATTGNYNNLINKPTSITANGGNADTVNGVRITVGGSAPSSPVNLKDVWFDTNTRLIKVYDGSWINNLAVFQ